MFLLINFLPSHYGIIPIPSAIYGHDFHYIKNEERNSIKTHLFHITLRKKNYEVFPNICETSNRVILINFIRKDATVCSRKEILENLIIQDTEKIYIGCYQLNQCLCIFFSALNNNRD